MQRWLSGWRTCLLIFTLLSTLFSGGVAAAKTLQSYAQDFPKVVPPAQQFVPVTIKGSPFVEAVSQVGGRRQVLSYIFLSTDLVNVNSYSGEPIPTLLAINPKGIITGIKVLSFKDPIFLIGIPPRQLYLYARQYVGMNVLTHVSIGGSGPGHVDAIAGATVTTVAEGETIMEAARVAAEKIGIIKGQEIGHYTLSQKFAPQTWRQLVDSGAVAHLVVTPQEMGQLDNGQPWISLYMAYLNVPAIGRNILPDWQYQWLERLQKQHIQAILLASDGQMSFKGVGFVRGGIFERIRLKQGIYTYSFSDKDYIFVNDLNASGAPDFSDLGIFLIREPSFVPVVPFNLIFLASRVNGTHRNYRTFDLAYQLPHQFYTGGPSQFGVSGSGGWAMWQKAEPQLILLGLLGVSLVVLVALRKRLYFAKGSRKYRGLRYGFLTVFLLFIGVAFPNQPSVTHLLTLFHGLWHLNPADLSAVLLYAPLVVVLFALIAAVTLVWGRGVFCGWVCPFGWLQELLFRLTKPVRRFELRFPEPVHLKLQKLKYVLFGLLLVASLLSLAQGERWAEVEPFKTVFYLRFLRPWPFDAYAVLLLLSAAVNYRFFCRYVCPLGGALGLASLVSGRKIKRYDFCSHCTICSKGCDIGAIDEQGRIDQKECLRCLDCEANYHDPSVCPVLIKQARERADASM